MGRWQPDARERLERAALDLFAERGFDQTTVPEITARAGLTTRTFFRHFADKREVLFGGQQDLVALAAELVADAPTEWRPAEVMTRRLPGYVQRVFGGQRDLLLQRKIIIAGTEALRERELNKMAALVDAVAATFRERGADDLTAMLVAETSIVVVRTTVARWLRDDSADSDLEQLVRESLEVLRRVWAVDVR